MLRAPTAFIRSDARELLLPVRTQLVALAHARAACAEFNKLLNTDQWQAFVQRMSAMDNGHWQEDMGLDGRWDESSASARAALDKRAAALVGVSDADLDSDWYLHGFRPGSGSAKVPLVRRPHSLNIVSCHARL